MKTVHVSLAQRSYPIHIGVDAMAQLPQLSCIQAASSLVLVSNHTVQALYGEQVQQVNHC
jgi:3-dehydroquinate synthetase